MGTNTRYCKFIRNERNAMVPWRSSRQIVLEPDGYEARKNSCYICTVVCLSSFLIYHLSIFRPA